MIRSSLIMAMGTLSMACASEESGNGDFTVIDLTDGEPCAAEQFQNLIGQPVDEIDRTSLPSPSRVYGPEDAITMDYRIDRLNVVFDATRTVIEVKCG